MKNLSARVRGMFNKVTKKVYQILPIPISYKYKIKNFLLTKCRFIFIEPTNIQPSLPQPSEQKSSSALDQSELPIANGIWEWADYKLLKDRVHAQKKLRAGQNDNETVPMINISKLDKFAASIHLPEPGLHPEVSIIIPVYNNIKLTLECLASIARNTDTKIPYEIIVADDASTDITAKVLSKIKNLRVKTHPKNLGFLQNCNATFPEARGNYTLLLNNDTQVQSGWLTALLNVYQSEPQVGAVGAKIIFPNGILQEAGAHILNNAAIEMIGYGESPKQPRYNYLREVDYCSGVCLLLKTDLLKELQGFDPTFTPAYYEVVDLCLRIKARGLRILYCPDAVIVHHLSKTSVIQSLSYKLQCAVRNSQKMREKWQTKLNTLDDVKLIAFYLPQYHPIPENDIWWGKGFTEWRNVTKAKQNFVGHYQPRLPADLGYYDLRVPEVMEEQTKLAKRYGIDAFCYYYYWFAGKRLLERPLEAMLETNTPNFPFCLCWANEDWTRRWESKENNVLMAQNHTEEDDIAVINDLCRYFKSPSYLKVNNKPLLLVYRVDHFPNFKRTAEIWRDVCLRNGIGEIYLAMVESYQFGVTNVSPKVYGCDAAVEFPPHHEVKKHLTHQLNKLNPEFSGVVLDYKEIIIDYCTKGYPNYPRFSGVTMGWDNTARKQNHSLCYHNATPGAFQVWLENAIETAKQQFVGDERLVFVNAWNEWAEGAYLEPDMRFGHAYLEAVKNAKEAHLLFK